MYLFGATGNEQVGAGDRQPDRGGVSGRRAAAGGPAAAHRGPRHQARTRAAGAQASRQATYH